MMNFTMIKKNASLVIEADDKMTKGIISCYGLDMDDNEVIQSSELNPQHPIIQNMQGAAHLLVWSDDETSAKKKARAIQNFLEMAGAHVLMQLAASKEHFNFWFEEHERFLETLRKYGYTSTIYDTSSGSMWVQSTFYQNDDLNAWIIQQVSRHQSVLEIAKTKANFDGGGNWYIIMSQNQTIKERNEAAQKKAEEKAAKKTSEVENDRN